VNQGLLRGTVITFSGKWEGCFCNQRRFPRPLCQQQCRMIQPQFRKLPWELSGQLWIILRPSHISLLFLISLDHYRKIILSIFVRNAFPDGIRVKAGPGELCTLELDMLQKCLQMLFWVWVNITDLEGYNWQRPTLLVIAKDSILGI
jgi:hypothetical protein